MGEDGKGSGRGDAAARGSLDETFVPSRDATPAPASALTPAPPAAGAGELLAGRYRIVRFIAQGGMGAVYEAEDVELGGRLALKTIRHDMAKDEWALERFKREIQLARKVTHPNVCRLFDVGHHKGAPGPVTGADGSLVFLTMELLEGETLARRIARDGRMASEAVVPIALQLASGLAAAHRAGVVHRDFKSENVILVPQSGAAEPRAVITDFGLARASEGAITASVVGGFVGSPGYMAPEQVEGGVVTPAADVYALGIVLYEMVTGTLPFLGETPFSVAMKRLKEPPPSPRKVVTDIDPALEALILKCLELKPKDRYPSAGEVVEALGGENPSHPSLRITRRLSERPKRLRRLAFAAGALVILAAALAAGLRKKPAPAGPPRVVAVLGFKNLSARPDTAWIGTALGETLQAELAAGDALRLVPAEAVARLKSDLALGDEATLSRETLDRIRSSLGADEIVSGAYLALGAGPGDALRLDVSVQDASGQPVAALSETGKGGGLIDLVARTGAELRRRLGAAALTSAQQAAASAALPSVPQAAQLYAEGLARLRQNDALGAREKLEKAVAADPTHALAVDALARAYARLGNKPRARELAKKAFDLSGGLDRAERLEIECFLHEISSDWAKAIEIARALVTFYPARLDYLLDLARIQYEADEPKDARETLAQARRLPPPDGDNPLIDLQDAVAALGAGDNKGAAALAASAADKAARTGARTTQANALGYECWAWQRMGELDRAQPYCDEAEKLCRDLADLKCLSAAMNASSSLLTSRGDHAGALKKLDEAISFVRKLGAEDSLAAHLINRGNARGPMGDSDGALRDYDEASAIYDRIDDRWGRSYALLNGGSEYVTRGEGAEAQRRLEEARRILHEVGDAGAEQGAIMALADAVRIQGDLARAKSLDEEALALARAHNMKDGVAGSLDGIGAVQLAQGDLAGARQTFGEAVRLHAETHDDDSTAGARIQLAKVDFYDGRGAAAVEPLKSAIAALRKSGVSAQVALGQAWLARALLASGQRAAAKAALAPALAAAPSLHDPTVRARVLLTSAQLDAALGKRDAARAAVRAVQAELARLALPGVAFEARLAGCKLEPGEKARACGEALRRDAAAKGYGLVAGRAAALKR